MEQIEKKDMRTFFTFQAETDCIVFHFSIENLKDMAEKFPDAFDLLFIDSDVRSAQILSYYLLVLNGIEKNIQFDQSISFKDIFAN